MRRLRPRSFGAASVFVGVALASASCSLLVDTSGLAGGGDLVDAAPAASDAPQADAVTFDAHGDGGNADTGTDASDGSTGPCPVGRGPAMVVVADMDGSFCVDSTETSDRQFNAFLAEPKANLPPAPAACSSKLAFGGITRADDDLPVVNVDWCDAWMFCAWAGKRLCGSRNGMLINDFTPANDPKISEWFAACSATGSKKFPYGDTVDPAACNGGAALVPVGSLPKCEGGYPGVFDMTGNASEWEDNCDVKATTPAMSECPPRGAGAATADAMTCALTVLPTSRLRQDRTTSTGIRCCSN